MRRSVLLLVVWANVGAWASQRSTPAPDGLTPSTVAATPDRLSSAAARSASSSGADDAGARRARAIATLNAIRERAGAGALATSSALDTSASRHAAYLDANGLHSAATVHDETAGLVAYSGSDPFSRIRTAGYRLSYATEVIGDIGSTAPDSACIEDLMNTVYHAALLLSRATQVGVAFGSGRYAGMCTIDLGAPFGAPASQVPSGDIVAYPGPGITVPSGTYAISAESPRPPLGLLPSPKAGTPILVGFRNEDYLAAASAMPRVVIDRFALCDAAGASIPSAVLADAAISGDGVTFDGALHGGFAALVPLRPLPVGRYTVTLRARIVGGRSLVRSSWSFDVAAP